MRHVLPEDLVIPAGSSLYDAHLRLQTAIFVSVAVEHPTAEDYANRDERNAAYVAEQAQGQTASA